MLVRLQRTILPSCARGMATTELFTHLFAGSAHAEAYAKYRPTYPSELFGIILKYFGDPTRRDVAVDIATGSGQAAIPIAEEFVKVIGIDASEAQVKKAPPAANIEFRVGTAESTRLEDSTADLVTVAQALHWFDLAAFYPEMSRILKPRGVLAVWGYATCTLHNPKMQALMMEFYDGTLGPYWSSRRALVDAQYVGMEPSAPLFTDVTRFLVPMVKRMPVDAFFGYLTSWSAYQTFKSQKPTDPDPLEALYHQFLEILGPEGASKEIEVTWPLFGFLARKAA